VVRHDGRQRHAVPAPAEVEPATIEPALAVVVDGEVLERLAHDGAARAAAVLGRERRGERHRVAALARRGRRDAAAPGAADVAAGTRGRAWLALLVSLDEAIPADGNAAVGRRCAREADEAIGVAIPRFRRALDERLRLEDPAAGLLRGAHRNVERDRVAAGRADEDLRDRERDLLGAALAFAPHAREGGAGTQAASPL
jgi:hypothetical protein